MKTKILLLLAIIFAFGAQDSFAQRYSSAGGGFSGMGGGGGGFMLGAGIASTNYIAIGNESGSAVSYWGLHLSGHIPISEKFTIQANLLAHLPQDQQGLGSISFEDDNVDEAYNLFALNVGISPLIIGNNNEGFGWAIFEAGLDASFASTKKEFKDNPDDNIDESEFSFGYVLGSSFQYAFNGSKIYLKSMYRRPFDTSVEIGGDDGIDITPQFYYWTLTFGYVFSI